MEVLTDLGDWGHRVGAVLRGKLDALMKAQQGRGADAATIVKDEFDQVYTKADAVHDKAVHYFRHEMSLDF